MDPEGILLRANMMLGKDCHQGCQVNAVLVVTTREGSEHLMPSMVQLAEWGAHFAERVEERILIVGFKRNEDANLLYRTIKETDGAAVEWLAACIDHDMTMIRAYSLDTIHRPRVPAPELVAQVIATLRFIEQEFRQRRQATLAAGQQTAPVQSSSPQQGRDIPVPPALLQEAREALAAAMRQTGILQGTFYNSALRRGALGVRPPRNDQPGCSGLNAAGGSTAKTDEAAKKPRRAIKKAAKKTNYTEKDGACGGEHEDVNYPGDVSDFEHLPHTWKLVPGVFRSIGTQVGGTEKDEDSEMDVTTTQPDDSHEEETNPSPSTEAAVPREVGSTPNPEIAMDEEELSADLGETGGTGQSSPGDHA